MKHFCSFFLVVFLSAGWLHAQIPPPTFEWAKTFGSKGDDNTENFAADDLGNVYIAGSFKDYICFDDTCLFTNPQDDFDIYLTKYDSLGNLVWTKSFGSRKRDGAVHLEVSNQGDVYLGASFIDSIQLDGFKVYTNELGGTFIARITPTGKVTWVVQSGNSDINAMAFNQRELVIGGFFFKPSLTFGNIVLNRNSEDEDNYLAKIDTSGKTLFAVAFGAKGSQFASVDDLCIGDSGDFYVSGGSNDSLFFGGIKAGSPKGAARYIAGFDKNGKAKWIHTFYSEVIGHYFSIKKIAPVSENRFVAVGRFKGDFWWNRLEYNNESYNHYYTLGFDGKGDSLWFKTYPGNFSIAQSFSNEKHFYVCGSAHSSHFEFEDTVINTRGTSDVFIVRHDSTGKVVWAKLVDSPADDGGAGITGDSKGNIFVMGYFLDHNTLVDSIVLSNSDPLADTYEPWIGRMARDSFLLPNMPPEPQLPPAILPVWRVYPNPVKDTVHISGQFQPGRLNFSLFDIKGSQIQNRNFTVGADPLKYSIILNNIPSGLYFLRLSQKNRQAVFKIVKRPDALP